MHDHVQVLSSHEVLDKIYMCAACSAKFLFKQDAEDHQEITGRRQFRTFDFE